MEKVIKRCSFYQEDATGGWCCVIAARVGFKQAEHYICKVCCTGKHEFCAFKIFDCEKIKQALEAVK